MKHDYINLNYDGLGLNLCGESNGGWYCTYPKDHYGDHHATSHKRSTVYSTWPNPDVPSNDDDDDDDEAELMLIDVIAKSWVTALGWRNLSPQGKRDARKRARRVLFALRAKMEELS